MTDTTTEGQSAPAPTPTTSVINHITINVPAAAPSPGKAVIAGTGMRQSKPAKQAGRQVLTPITADKLLPNFDSLFSPEPIRPERYTDAKTQETFLRLQDGSGAMAVFKEDPSDPNNVTLLLADTKGAITMQGHKRGFEATLGGVKETGEAWRVLDDTLSCGAAKQDITVKQLESVTREKLQQFAADHPRLGEALRHVNLPATVIGGVPATAAQAMDAPSHYRACPENRSGIVLELLTEKSAAR